MRTLLAIFIPIIFIWAFIALCTWDFAIFASLAYAWSAVEIYGIIWRDTKK
jgi:hypothetical protein